METGVDVWLRDNIGQEGWISGTVMSKISLPSGSFQIVVRSDRGDILEFQIEDENAELNDMKLRNAETDSNVENLIKLPYLHEPAILYCLEQRYYNSEIYTYTGPILIAVNPFKKVNLYSPQVLEMYYNVGLLKSQGIDSPNTLPPHVYAIADAAYREMMNSMHQQGYGVTNNPHAKALPSGNQAILISGESGAGKTESTKIVLKYLTTVGNSSGGLDLAIGSIMDKILQSNPILEAFGNARTVRNDNSSRFGKYIELNFNRRGHLVGGTIRTYLLEKVRLPKQQQGERNFHVFYQMAKGGSAAELDEWKLGDLPYFYYANQGNIFDLRHIRDDEEYRALRNALNVLNFDPTAQHSLFRIMAGLLHLGQLQFLSDGDEGSMLNGNDASVVDHAHIAADLLGVEFQSLIRTLTVRVIKTREESYDKKLTAVQASDARDAFAKAIYGKIFDWIVETINKSIQVDPSLVKANIGVLDIFGFECFQQNSFEQLCINYTNETLQQQFNQYVFKMEQEEYQREKIEWSFIEFPDNQDCLNLIEHKQNGILAMLDDECKLPKATDEKLASRMYKALESHSRFSASIKQKRDFQFCIKHYAGPVVYQVHTFVEKNKDELPKEASLLLQDSKASLLSMLFTVAVVESSGTAAPSTTKVGSVRGGGGGGGGGMGANQSISVGSQFKDQLSKLMEKIYSTTPHYIRCLKPNDENLPDCFHRLRTTEQLRYGGVLEAVRVARSGFPVRLSHTDFYSKYRPLANPYVEITASLPRTLTAATAAATTTAATGNVSIAEARGLCEKLMEALWDEYVPSLEDIEQQHTPHGLTGKKLPHGKVGRRKSRLMEMSEWKGKSSIAKESVQLGISKVFLRKQAHDLLEARRSRRLTAAARKVQSFYRSYSQHKYYKLMREAAIYLQSIFRGYLARQVALSLQQWSSAIRIQSCFRRHVVQGRYLDFYWALVTLQRCFRARKRRTRIRLWNQENKALLLQRWFRQLRCRVRYVLYRRAIIHLQGRWRMKQARNQLKTLRLAARDVGRLQQSNEELKLEIERLKSRAAEESKKWQEEQAREASRMQEEALEKALQEIQRLKEELAIEKRQKEDFGKKLELSESKLRLYEEASSNNSNNHSNGAMDSRLAMKTPRKSVLSNLFPVDGTSSSNNGGMSTPVAVNVNPNNPLAARTPSTRPTSVRKSIFKINEFQSDEIGMENHDIQRLKDELAEEKSANRRMQEELSRLRYLVLNQQGSTAAGQGDGRSTKAVVERRSSLSQRTFSGSDSVGMDMGSRRRSLRGGSGSSSSSTNNNNNGGGGGYDSSSHMEAMAAAAAAAAAALAGPESFDIDQEDSDDDSDRSSFQESSLASRTSSPLPTNLSSSSSSIIPGGSKVLTMEEKKFKAAVEKWQEKFSKGIHCTVWHGKTQKASVTLKLDGSNEKLLFSRPPSRTFGLFGGKDIPPVSLLAILDCSAGCDPGVGITDDDSTVFTITSTGENLVPCHYVVKVDTKENRNNLISGIRMLISHANEASDNAVSNLVSATLASNKIASMVNPMRANPGGDSNSSTVIRKNKRMSVREIVLEESIAVTTHASHNGNSRRSSMAGDSLVNAATSASLMKIEAGDVEELKNLLASEKSSVEKLRTQNMQLSNDLEERDEQITVLKKKEDDLMKQMMTKEKLYEQDALVRLQLGNRLQQVLFDKEEAMEKIEALKMQVDSLRQALTQI